ncbi:hypothetical protein NHX12_019198, partial [Muraenolepis orangiensis]
CGYSPGGGGGGGEGGRGRSGRRGGGEELEEGEEGRRGKEGEEPAVRDTRCGVSRFMHPVPGPGIRALNGLRPLASVMMSYYLTGSEERLAAPGAKLAAGRAASALRARRGRL